MLQLRFSHVSMDQDCSRAVLSLPCTKSGQRKGQEEKVIIEDKLSIVLLLIAYSQAITGFQLVCVVAGQTYSDGNGREC